LAVVSNQEMSSRQAQGAHQFWASCLRSFLENDYVKVRAFGNHAPYRRRVRGRDDNVGCIQQQIRRGAIGTTLGVVTVGSGACRTVRQPSAERRRKTERDIALGQRLQCLGDLCSGRINFRSISLLDIVIAWAPGRCRPNDQYVGPAIRSESFGYFLLKMIESLMTLRG
jgi:hypothetical protein